MSLKTLSRRDVVIGCLTVAGFSGCSASSSQPDQPGAEGLTARSIPAGSDRLAVFDLEGDNRTVYNVSNAVLTREWFNSIPDPVTTLATATTGPLAGTDVGKLACISSNETDGSAAIVWAHWTDENLATALGSDAQQETSGSEDGWIRYRTGTTSAAQLTDTAFAIGDHKIVRSVVDVWHRDGEVVGRDVLDPFDRTDRDASIRFAAQGASDRTESRSEPYDRIENVSTALKSVDSGAALTIQYQVDSIDIAPTVESILRDDLVASSRLPSSVGLQLDIERDNTLINITYETESASVANTGPKVFKTAMNIVGLV